MADAEDRITPYDLPDQAPETWHPAARMAKGLFGPIERFLHVQAASAIVLVVTTIIALVWANSPWSASYEHLWHTPVVFSIGGFESARSIHFWINDGLMVIFFFVVGLEIRREIHEGELSDLKRASLPIAAAIGGMLVPAGIYLAINSGTAVQRGWGVPMATDIAFAVGVLTLLGKRVPAALRVLLLALAIIDDIGAILVIALFYSDSFAPMALLIVAGGIALVVLMQRIGIRSPMAYIIPGIIIWDGALESGIHPTIAGVVIGMLTPVKSWYGVKGFVRFARRAVESFQVRSAKEDADPHSLVGPLEDLARARREALPPVVRLQQLLHTYVAYLIMPLFALANAGVALGGVSLDQAGAFGVLVGITGGLVVGKIVGVFLASFIAVKLGLSSLPRGVTWKGIVVVGSVAGIGFTMAIFIAGLAFEDAAILGVSKLAVLIASAAAAMVGLVLGRAILPKEIPLDIAVTTASQAESSTAY